VDVFQAELGLDVFFQTLVEFDFVLTDFVLECVDSSDLNFVDLPLLGEFDSIVEHFLVLEDCLEFIEYVAVDHVFVVQAHRFHHSNDFLVFLGEDFGSD